MLKSANLKTTRNYMSVRDGDMRDVVVTRDKLASFVPETVVAESCPPPRENTLFLSLRSFCFRRNKKILGFFPFCKKKKK